MLCLVSDSAIIDSWSSFDYLIVQYSCTMSKILSAVNLFCQQIYLYGLKSRSPVSFFYSVTPSENGFTEINGSTGFPSKYLLY